MLELLESKRAALLDKRGVLEQKRLDLKKGREALGREFVEVECQLALLADLKQDVVQVQDPEIQPTAPC